MATRGRPRKFTDDEIAAFRAIYPEVRTKRGLENKIHMVAAFSVIHGTEIEPFFNDPETERWREGIMVELGKLEDPALIHEIALQITELPGSDHMTVKELSRLVKIVRLDILRNGFVNSGERRPD